MPNNTRDVRHRGGLLLRGSLVALASLLAAVLAGCGGPGAHPAHRAPGAGAGSSVAGESGSGLPGSNGSQRGNGSPGQRSAGAVALSGVGGGALFGGDVPLLAVQGQLGRKLAIVRDYYRIGEAFPDLQDRQLMAAGTTLLVSLDSVPGSGPSYASIAAGQHDRAILAFLHQVEQAAVSYRLSAIYVTFEHEADSLPHTQLGSPAEFIAAWDHIHHLAESAHLDWNTGGRLHWAWILTSVAFRSAAAWDARPGASAYWPGTGEVDIVAVDGYNADGCRSARPGSNMVATGTQAASPAKLFGPVVAFAQAHGGLPVFIAEWGTVPYTSPGMQPGYIDQMRAYVSANPEIAAALYWNNHGQHNGCDYSLDNRPAALAALAAMGHSSGLQGRIAPAN